MTQKTKKILFLFSSFFFSVAFKVKAICPVCVVAVGAGFGLSRWIGVDDIISSLWIGAFLASVSIWTIDWIKNKKWNFKFYKPVIVLVYYVAVLYPLWHNDLIGHPLNKIFGIDKILFGATIGTAFLLASNRLHMYLKKKNEGKSYFPYQKVVVPVIVLALLSIIFYLLIIWRII